MATQGKQGPAVAPNKTPGPTKVDPRTVTEFQKDYTYGRGNYGSNSYGGPSSLTPGMTTDGIPNLAQKRDAVLDEVQANGLARSTNIDDTGRTVSEAANMAGKLGGAEGDPQLRRLASGNVPTHSGTKGAASGPKIPGTLIHDEAPLPKNYSGS